MRNVDADGLRIASYGSAKDYDLRIERATPTELRVFERSSIPLTANTTHTVAPDWGTLGDGLLMILVDVGSDGTVDDTLKLQNEVTGTGSQGSLIPKEYRLEQNYPNPFNPMTVIRYELPAACDVRLAVYDVLGREVAVLVDEKKAPGVYTVEWNAAHLASGVYIYRLTAGSYTRSMKMILMK
jgi:hypothetical protein